MSAAPRAIHREGSVMPTYDYACATCGHEFQEFHGVNTVLPACPMCGGSPQRKIRSAPAVHGHMARGRDQAASTFEPVEYNGHGAGCPCCHGSGLQ